MKKQLITLYLWIFILLVSVSFAAITNSSNNATAEAGSETARISLQQKIQKLKAEEPNIFRIENRYADFARAVESKNYQNALTIAEDIDKLVQQVYDLKQRINQTGYLVNSLKSRGFQINEAAVNYNLGLNEYKINNYDAASNYIEISSKNINPILINESVRITNEFGQLLEKSQGSQLLPILNATYIKITKAAQRNEYEMLFAADDNFLDINRSIKIYWNLSSQKDSLVATNHSVDRINDNLNRLKSLFNDSDYQGYFALINKTVIIFEEIYLLDAGFNETRAKLEEFKQIKIDYREAVTVFNQSLREYAFENYEKSTELLDKCNKIIRDLEQKYLVNSILAKANSKFRVTEFVAKYWFALILLTFIAYCSYRVFSYYLYLELKRIKLVNLQNEKKSINEHAKRLQIEYFKEITIDKDTYLSLGRHYEERLEKIDKSIPILQKEIDEKEAYLNNHPLKSLISIILQNKPSKRRYMPVNK